MMDSSRQFIVRYPASYALKFSGRKAEPAADREATKFDSAEEAAAAIARAGVSPRAVQIETIGAEGERFSL
jgi:hypothetical protein